MQRDGLAQACFCVGSTKAYASHGMYYTQADSPIHMFRPRVPRAPVPRRFLGPRRNGAMVIHVLYDACCPTCLRAIQLVTFREDTLKRRVEWTANRLAWAAETANQS